MPLVISDDMIASISTYETWRGVYPAICTPFAADDSVDLQAQRRVVRFALECGAHGIVAFGLAGEVLKLSPEERRTLTDLIVEETAAAVPVFVGVGAPSIRASIEPAREAEAGGESGLADERLRELLPVLVFAMQDSIDHYNACAKYILVQRGVLESERLRSPAETLGETSRALLQRHLAPLRLTTGGVGV